MEEVTNQELNESKYHFSEMASPEKQAEEDSKEWNHRKLRRVVPKDIFLTYQEIQEMILYNKLQKENAMDDLDTLKLQIEETKKRIASYEQSEQDWIEERDRVERDIPEIGEKAAKERADDEKKKAKHEANLRGEGDGRAFEQDASGNIVDVTNTK